MCRTERKRGRCHGIRGLGFRLVSEDKDRRALISQAGQCRDNGCEVGDHMVAC